MAAPSNTLWGNIVGDYGRIGICFTNATTENGSVSGTAQIWFWSKYSVSDNANTLYYDAFLGQTGSATTSKGSTNIKTTVDSGKTWNTNNQMLLKSYRFTADQTTTAQKYYFYAKLANVDRVGGTMYVNSSYTISKLPTYTVSYNANGGTGAPAAQTKTYDVALKLSTTKPTRTGYKFLGWSTNSGATTATYSAGASFSTNENTTLYAVWIAKTYTITYDANGGTGAPAVQTKTHGAALTLATAIPSRTGYTFLGWSETKTATTATYSAGASYTKNASVTLYAVWVKTYIAPSIYNLIAYRCDANGVEAEEGTYARVKFNWKTTNPVGEVKFYIGTTSYTIVQTGTAGNVDSWNGEFSTESSFTVTVSVSDSGGTTTAKTTLPGAIFPFDVHAGGDGVSFGKPAERGKTASLGGVGVVDFGFDANFNQPVYGKVLGLDKLPAIPQNSELNDYINTGCWSIQSNGIAATITCGGKNLGTADTVPPARAGRFEVNSATGEGIRLAQWSYLRQRFIPYNSSNAVWERDITREGNNVWTYGDWWRSSLTPEAAKNVYHEQKLLWGGELTSGMYMTAGHTAALKENVSEQANGIVLVFCYYNSTSDTNWGWIARYVPKILVELRPGGGHTFELTNSGFGSVGTKYLYINNDSITGHADNNASGTSGTGIAYNNAKFVLRYVIGV